ncbi:N-acetylmuramoyl-L-alanine amidase [Nocardiopsis algeriensis]|uniref:N-acetylmuramoyl-L-alanine amidase n=1 Tax=Nocardiopsis algeriensis TaxID=1478215 RepID=UPI003B435B2B
MSRSQLGWSSTSPASYAEPRSGLVVHYDSSDQGLAAKSHDACLSYWKSTRDFHTGSARGWTDIGYCVDEDTQILTEDGWRSFEEIGAGDTVLTLDHRTGTSRWQPLLAVNVFPARPRRLLRMEGADHSSLTTAEHRWPVERRARRERAWATTESLDRGDRIPMAAPCTGLPQDPKWSDALVELVAWFWAEEDGTPPGSGAVLHRPERRGPGGAARLRGVLHTLFGPPREDSAATAGDAPRWREERGRRGAEFHLSARAERLLREQAPGRVPSHAFLRSLTRAQLELFTRVCLAARGNGRSALGHGTREAAEAFQFAAILAGHATSLRHRQPGPRTGPRWRVELLRRAHVSPVAAAARTPAFTVAPESYGGRIWCPTTPDGTWLARRAGTVYFTGNSFMCCAHGYVLEGRGLYRQQAAQPGGNSTHYSVTLATGPKDEITAAQIDAVRALREWLVQDHGVSGRVLGHRDFISTSCPGDKAYRMVEDGTFEQPPGANTGGTNPLIGLKKGDSGEAVKALQELLRYAGQKEALGEHGVDGHYGDGTAEALRLARKSVGSAAKPGYGDKMTGHAYAQLIAAVSRHQSRPESTEAAAA